MKSNLALDDFRVVIGVGHRRKAYGALTLPSGSPRSSDKTRHNDAQTVRQGVDERAKARCAYENGHHWERLPLRRLSPRVREEPRVGEHKEQLHVASSRQRGLESGWLLALPDSETCGLNQMIRRTQQPPDLR
jgi:hypothetical protein